MLYARAAVGLLIAALILMEARDPQFRAAWKGDPARRARNLSFLGVSLGVMAVLTPAGAWLRASLPPLARWGGPWLLEAGLCAVVAARGPRGARRRRPQPPPRRHRITSPITRPGRAP